jgi:hypothetical protein
MLLMIVAEGGGNWDARRIDLTVSVRHGPGNGTVLPELGALRQRELVARDNSRSGVGGRWTVTAAAHPYLQQPEAPNGRVLDPDPLPNQDREQ